MTTNCAIILFLVTAFVITSASLPCLAAEQKKEEQKKEKNIWTEGEQRGPALEPERGPERGRGPGGPGVSERGRGGGPPRFELTDDEVNRIMNSLKQSDPNAVKELEKLRKENPEKFQAELWRFGREEFDKIIKERIEGWRRQRQLDFQQWLNKNYPKESETLAKLRNTEPNVYIEKSDRVRDKYWPIFEEERRNPELAEVLKEDLELKDKTNELVIKIKDTKNEKEKAELTAQLQEVVSDQYDLILKRKQIAYNWLIKRLESLQKQVKESMDDIGRLKDPKVKEENVKERMKYLTEGSSRLRWD